MPSSAACELRVDEDLREERKQTKQNILEEIFMKMCRIHTPQIKIALLYCCEEHLNILKFK